MYVTSYNKACSRDYLVHYLIQSGLKKIRNGKQLTSTLFLPLVKVVPGCFVRILFSQQGLMMEYWKDTNQKRLKAIWYHAI